MRMALGVQLGSHFASTRLRACLFRFGRFLLRRTGRLQSLHVAQFDASHFIDGNQLEEDVYRFLMLAVQEPLVQAAFQFFGVFLGVERAREKPVGRIGIDFSSTHWKFGVVVALEEYFVFPVLCERSSDQFDCWFHAWHPFGLGGQGTGFGSCRVFFLQYRPIPAGRHLHKPDIRAVASL